MKKVNFSLIVIALVAVLGIAQVCITHSLAASSVTAREMELKANVLEEKNEILKQEIDELGSLKRIISKAKSEGFIAQSSIVYVSTDFAVAMRN